MNDNFPFEIINGIKCYSPGVATDYKNYPDSGFELTEQNANNNFWVRSRNRLFKKILEKNIKKNGKSKYLEIGCGTGDFIRQINKNDNLDIVGSEIYLKGILYAKQNIPNVEFVQFDVAQGVMGDDFDIIVAFDVIEHIEDDLLALFNMHKMLRNDGCLIITVPQYMALWGKLDEIVKHKRRYSKDELKCKIQNTGFQIQYSTSFVFVLFPLMLVSRLFDFLHRRSSSDREEFAKRVELPRALNWIFDIIMRVDEVLIGMGIPLPFGGTLMVIARKK